MDNPRAEKVAVVDEVRQRLEESAASVVTEYRGLTVADLAELRRSLRAAGGDYKVFKNTLVRLAIAGGPHQPLEDLLTGPTAITFVQGDVSGVAKALREFSRANPHLIVTLLERFYRNDDPPEVLPFVKRYLIVLQTEGVIDVTHPVQQIFSKIAHSVVQSFDHIGRSVGVTSTTAEIDLQINMAEWHLNIVRSQAYLEMTDAVSTMIIETRKFVVRIPSDIFKRRWMKFDRQFLVRF